MREASSSDTGLYARRKERLRASKVRKSAYTEKISKQMGDRKLKEHTILYVARGFFSSDSSCPASCLEAILRSSCKLTPVQRYTNIGGNLGTPHSTN